MSRMDIDSTPRKVCFVTIGATAGFDSLIRATLHPTFLTALSDHGYEDLRLQHGKDGRIILEEFEKSQAMRSGTAPKISVSGFDFNKQGLGAEMRAAKATTGSLEGVVISHAGSGSILAALRIAVPLIVVPNPSLLDNHQVELAEELAAQGYVVHGHLDDLPAAIRQSENMREKKNPWPPNNEKADPSGRGIIGIMDDELGFVD